MNDYEKLTKLCFDSLKSHDFPSDILGCNYDSCESRLNLELQEIKKKDEAWMFLRFYYAVKSKKIDQIENNEHNLLTWFLLGVCPSVNIDKGPAFTEAELPDIDVDYHPLIREYLKDEFTFKKYGENHVCNISTYQTYDIKSSLIDMARVLGESRDEILGITTQLSKMKDEEGEDLNFESIEEEFEKIAQKISENKTLTKFDQLMVRLKDYKKAYPNVWNAAKELVSASYIDWKKTFDCGKPPRRKKSLGTHASGLIISSVNLNEFVPLVVPPGSREKGLQSCAWVEGLADTDCSSVGLVKFDYLSLEANAKIAECNRLIMERHGLDSCWAIPGFSNWSDISYLNDLKSLAMANDGDLKGVFQFDSPGIRRLAKKGGVTSFDDLVAYTSLYRPGPMDTGMHDEYCDRKNGKKSYEIHPVLLPILGKTYGVMCYQEQVMRVLNVVGKIPLKDCEGVRKAISKKKKDKIEKVREQFIDNGKITLNISAEEASNLFDQIEAFAGYGFNLSHAVAYSYISARQLVQKAHYPLEFYTAALRSLKTADERIIIYINDAKKRNINVNKINLNKSKSDFSIFDDEIYYGFSKIKGIGHESSIKIVENQPYSGMKDFMDKVGAEAKIMQPLICLGVFKERDIHTSYLYYEAYRKIVKYERDRISRHKVSLKNYENKLRSLIGENTVWEHGFDDNYFGKLRSMLDDEGWIELCRVKKKYDKCIATFSQKSLLLKDVDLPINEFVPPTPDNRTFVLDRVSFKTYKSLKRLLKSKDEIDAEIEFYGFPWKNEFECCEKYKGFTFDDYEIDIVKINEGCSLPVEVKIVSAEHVVSRSGKMMYWKLRVVDAIDPNPRTVTVWENDYDKFESLLKVGNIVRMRLLPPEHPYPNYSLEGLKPWEKHKKNPYSEDPQWDLRVVLLGKEIKKDKYVDDEDDSYLMSSGKRIKKESDDE